MSLPPGPRWPSPVQMTAWWTRSVPFFERCRERYGKRFTVRFPATPPFVYLTEPDELKQMFTASPEVLHPGEGARILEPLVGSNSVLLLDEAEHLEQRKLLLGPFHRESMARLEGLMTEVSEQEVARWPRDEPLELHPRFAALTLEVMLRAVFGLEAGARLDALRDRLTAILGFMTSPLSMLSPFDRVLGHLKPVREFKRGLEQADALIFEQIEERRTAGEDGDDILAMLLAARHEDGTEMSAQELRDELVTLLVAGHETIASELAWCSERLVAEPRVLGSLVEAVDNGDDAYLTATVQETLRRRPVLPNAQPRLTTEPIGVGDWSYPAGVCLVANTYLLHHDADIYPDPYAFRPERFLGSEPGTYTWIPFGGGRRRCLGASFATLEMKVVLRTLLSAVELSPAHDGLERTRRRAITVSPRRGSPAVLRPREEAVSRQPLAA